MINFGIDLGTTNSAIAKFEQGNVEIFRNPVSLKQTLPSVVAFRKGRTLVGDKAKEFLKRDPDNVAGLFKRKMGTSEYYTIKSTQQQLSPINLSAHIIKELKNFVHTGENVAAAVITIPASFDTIQSNATKKAGYEAGLEQVVLLQEPIAASLAYANKGAKDNFEEGQWLVYDFGGGTFDVALVRIQDGEMRVLDHEGDNFLGGTDFDQEIVEKIIIPYLEQTGNFSNLEKELKSATGKYNRLYHLLLHKAEEAKIILSNNEQADIEFETEDDEGELIDAYLTLGRNQFQQLIEAQVDRTTVMIQEIFSRNEIHKSEVNFILMVGGSTYIPHVRNRVGEQLGIPVNCNIDPTTAVAVGAAFYAGTKPKKIAPKEETASSDTTVLLEVKVAYAKTSQDDEETFIAAINGEVAGLFYRIIRQDGGFDSGLKPLTKRINEELPLVKNAYNYFSFTVFDEHNQKIRTNAPVIGITHGRYSVVGQPLPHDICLEVDDIENEATGLEIVFEKNSILPSKRTLNKEITRTIKKGSDDHITINVLEGPSYAMPAANQPIGFISIKGRDLNRDLIKGSDIEITLEMSESRDLRIEAYLMLTDQEFENVFTPSERKVNVNRLNQELVILLGKLNNEIRQAEHMEDFRTAEELMAQKKELRRMIMRSKKLTEDDVTDEKFQLEDKKRKIAQTVDNLTRDKRLNSVKMEYFELKKTVEYSLEENKTESDQAQFDLILSKEKGHLASNSPMRIQQLIDQLLKLRWKLWWRDPQYVISLFYHFAAQSERFKNKKKADEIIKVGEKAIEEQKYEKLRVYVSELYAQLPAEVQKRAIQGGTGIG